MEIIGYVLAVVIGISLGLVGSGGSILSVPLLVYFFDISAILATAYSLFIVGVASAGGAIKFAVKGEVDFKTAAIFAVPSIITVYAVRRYLMPNLPEIIFSIGDFPVSRDAFILVVFSLIMLWAGLKMILPKKEPDQPKSSSSPKYGLVMIQGAVVGAVTGFVGAGGGFLTIPALVLLVGLPMKKAVATSLFIITVRSLLGFIGDIQTREIDWGFLVLISAISVVGIFIGMWMGKSIDGLKLKKGFGWFVVLMAVFMLIREGASL